MRHRTTGPWVAAAVAALAALGSVPQAWAQTPKPNVIVILADDLGWGELGVQGRQDIPTPHIDSIAAGGVRFTQGYVSGPYCSPTRAGLLTGRYQTRFGHEFNEGGATGGVFGLPLDQTTMAQRLKAAGYATAAIGKWHLGKTPAHRPMARGFDEFYGTIGNSTYFHPQLIDSRISPDPARVDDDAFYTTEAYADRAVEWIEAHREQPFFLYLPFNAQHAPLEAPQEYLDRFAEIENPTRRKFAAMMSALDDAVGRVLDAVRAGGLEENTLIVFLADNGGPTQQTTSNNLPLRGAKATTLEGGVRVPFFVQWKGRIPAGVVDDRPVIQLDILPTALSAAGVAIDPQWQLDGVDLLPYLTGENAAAPHESLFWRFGKQWAVRHGDWKLVASRLDAQQPQLFNLSDDPGELHDLSVEHPERVAELRALWEAWDADNIPALWQPNRNPNAGGQGARGRRAARRAAEPAAATP